VGENILKEEVMTEAQKEKFYSNVKHRMIDKKVTQRDFAAAAGVSEQMVSMVINGAKEPPLKVILAIAKVLGTTVDELLN
jgi:transcriptional regulator with XRE-family HTH domain